jgi:radical SAM superfamily enzyme YgiQ (UPF0313 family)
MTIHVLITAIPAQDITRPPGILGILAGCCEAAGVGYDIFDLNLHMHQCLPEDICKQLTTDFLINEFRSVDNQRYYQQMCCDYLKLIQQTSPTHLAISVFTQASILAADFLLNYLKQNQIDCKIIIGGLGVKNSVNQITGKQTFGEYCLSNNLIDYCVYGEGELAFVELLKGNIDYPGINQDNQPQLLNLDILPTPSYKQIHPSNYFYSNAPEILINGSRGCVRDCTFCDVASYWKKYIYKSGVVLAAELFNAWKTTGVLKFDFSDSLINGSISEFRKFNKQLIQYKNSHPDFVPRYKGQFICRPATQFKEIDYAEMAEAGCETIVVGIESFSNSIRDHMKKKFSNADIDNHFESCARYGIKNVLLLLAGYPTETPEEHALQLEYLKKYQIYSLSRIIYSINIEVSGLAFLENTPLLGMQDDLQVIFPHWESAGARDEWITFSNPSLTAKERLRRSLEIMQTAYKLGYKVLHFHQKIDEAERRAKKYQTITQHPIFKVELVS